MRCKLLQGFQLIATVTAIRATTSTEPLMISSLEALLRLVSSEITSMRGSFAKAFRRPPSSVCLLYTSDAADD